MERHLAKSIPPDLPPALHSRARLTVMVATMLLVASTSVAIVSVAYQRYAIAAVCAATGVFMAAAPRVMRHRASVPVAVHVVVFGGWIAISATVFMTGGLGAPALGWFALLPTAALFLGGRRPGRFWLGIVIFGMGALLFIEVRGLLPAVDDHTTDFAARRFVAASAGVMMLLFLMRRYETEKERMLAQISDANRALALSRDEALAIAAELAVAKARVIDEARQQRKLEIELRHAQKLDGLGRLASGLAHELNTPLQFVADSVLFSAEAVATLAGLIGKYQALAAECHGCSSCRAAAAGLAGAEEHADLPYLLEQVPTALTRAADGTRRMEGIVKAMQGFSQRDITELSSLDVNDAITTTLTIAAHELRGVADVVTVYEESLPAVLCHAGEVHQVILNLLVNAAHAIADVVGDTGARGCITIRTAQRGEHVVVTVGDTGAGIPEVVRAHIFEPFFTTKDVGRGTGQGLTISHTIVVDKHGGQLDFDTLLGSGTTFRVSLPIAGPPPALAPAGPITRPAVPAPPRVHSSAHAGACADPLRLRTAVVTTGS